MPHGFPSLRAFRMRSIRNHYVVSWQTRKKREWMSTRKAVPQPGTGEDKERGLTGMERQAIQRSWDFMSRLLPPSGERCGVWGNAPVRGSRVADPRGLLGQRPDPSESVWSTPFRLTSHGYKTAVGTSCLLPSNTR